MGNAYDLWVVLANVDVKEKRVMQMQDDDENSIELENENVRRKDQR